jgi:poly(3-hydroxyalkanoate) synthetase
MLGSSLRGGAEAVGGEVDRISGRPGKVEWLIDSASEKEDRPHTSQVQANEWSRQAEGHRGSRIPCATAA